MSSQPALGGPPVLQHVPCIQLRRLPVYINMLPIVLRLHYADRKPALSLSNVSNVFLISLLLST